MSNKKGFGAPCYECGCQYYERPGVNHILHLLLSIVTAGFWIPMWILLVMNSWSVAWRCGQCGVKK